MKKLSELHRSYLEMFTPGSYGMSLPHSIAKTLEIKGLIEWRPPKYGTPMWQITDKGREALRANND